MNQDLRQRVMLHARSEDMAAGSSGTLWHRLRHGVRRLRQRADWESFVTPDWADRIMVIDVTDRFNEKQGRTTGRLVLEQEGRQLTVYLKRHYELPWWRRLLALLFPRSGWSPALQEARHLEWARAQGWAVPDVVAAGEDIGPWGRLQSFLAVEELPDMLPLSEAIPLAWRLLDGSTFRRWKRGLIAELARLTRTLHQRRCFHKDLYLCHFFIPRSALSQACAWHGQVHLIDLHRFGRHRWLWRMWQVKDLAQLLYSSEIPGVEAGDRARFWRLYLGPARKRRLAQLLKWWIRFKWQTYRRHNARHKTPQSGSPSWKRDGRAA
jgi:hypothetical protein